MAAEVGDLYVKLSLLSAGFLAGIKEAGVEAEGFSGKMEKVGTGLLTVGKKFAEAGVGVAAVSLKMAGDWQASMIKLTTSAGETGTVIDGKLSGPIADVSDKLLKMSVDTATSTKELADGMYFVESAGFHGADGLRVMQAAAEGAKAEGANLSTVADALTTALHDMGGTSKDAVPFMDMMIKAVGSGKMTMEQFAGSLHSVLPQAHAAGISFPEVAGAIATMTVAGTSADQATQMLGHTITSLQTPNAQAVKYMSQMGISAVDLSSHLGERGLTGTISLVDKAILDHMGKDGLILQSAFNKSQSAAKDLNVMLQAMPPSLRKYADEVRNGSLTSADFNKAIGGMPANLQAQGREFLTLYKNANSFSDSLRRGTPDTVTFAAALKQVLGDSVDANTALQIGGQNMATFKANTDAVAGAAKNAGDHIETWGTITKGFNFKIDQLKQGLITTAIHIGTFLIPKVMDLIDLISAKAGPIIHDFGQKFKDAMASPVVHEAMGILAQLWRDLIKFTKDAVTATMNLWHALQPVAGFLTGVFFVAISNIGKTLANVVGPALVAVTGFLRDHAQVIKYLAEVVMAAFITKLLYTKALLAVDMFTTMVSGIGKAITAYQGFVKALATGQVFDTMRLKAMYAADAVKGLAVKEGEAAVAAEGAAGAKGFGSFVTKLGNSLPIIGGVLLAVGYLSDKMGHMLGVGDHTALSIEKLTNAFIDMHVGMQQTNTDMGRTATGLMLITQKMNDNKPVQGLKDMDAALAGLVSSGHAAAALEGVNSITTALGNMGVSAGYIHDQVLPKYYASLDDAARQARLAASATDGSTAALNANATATDNSTSATAGFTDAVTDAMNKQQDLSAGLNASRALDDYNRQVKTLTQSFKDNGSSITGNTEAAMNNRDAIRNSAQAALDIYNAQVQVSGPSGVPAATQKLKDQIKTLVDQSSQSKDTRKKVQEYIDTLNLIPKAPTTVIGLDTSGAMSKIALINKALQNIGGDLAHAMVVGGTKVQAYADGGFVPGPKGAPQLAIVHGGEYVVSNDMQDVGHAAGGSGGGVGGGVNVTINIGGSVVAERDVRDMVQTLMLQLGARYSTSYTPYKR